MSNTSWKIEVQQDYFARISAKEYSDDAGMAVIREFAQNSADAGATKVEFSFVGSGDGARLTVKDNGRGCSAETVKSRLLTPLGTEKEADSIGGFGKAKELLFFANSSWNIATRDVRVQGSFLSVQNFDEGCNIFSGFAATVQLPPALHSATWNAAKNFLRCSERPGVEWVLNGSTVYCCIERSKRAAKDFGFCKAYVDRDSNDNVIYLRTGGLLTAMRRGYHGSAVGRVVLEVTGASSQLLTPARDWFRSSGHRAQVENWLNQLVTNATQTLADDFGDEVRFEDLEEVTPFTAEELVGVGSYDVVPVTSGLAAKIQFNQNLPITGLTRDDDGLPVGGEAAEALVDAILDATDPERVLDVDDELSDAVIPYKVAPPAHRPRSDGFDMGLLPRVATVNRLVVHTGGKAQAKVAAKWLKKNADAAAQALAAWATAVRVVATKSRLPVDAIGFTFAGHAEAEFIRAQGRFALLLNPTNIDLGAVDAHEELIDRALHEAAHLKTGGGHDESFVTAESSLRRKVRGALVRGAVARALRTSEVQFVEEV